MFKRFCFATTLLLALTAPACKNQNDATKDFKRAPLPVGNIIGFVVNSAPLQSGITASGSLLPFEQTELHPEVSGRVISINLPEGKKVGKGSLLVKLFDGDLLTQVTKAEAQLAIARTTAERLKGLLGVKGVSQQEYDLSELQIKNIEAEIELLRVRIRQTEIRAPYDGVIGLRQISPGAYITPATAVATIRDDTRLRLEFSVPEKYAPLIRMGQQISFQVDGSDKKFTAAVSASEQNVDATTRDLRYRAMVNGHDAALSPGRFAAVDIALTAQPKAILIPTAAIIPQAREKKVVVSRNGRAEFVSVKTGVRQAGNVEITEGLQIGDTIVTTGLLFLKPGNEIKFTKVESE